MPATDLAGDNAIDTDAEHSEQGKKERRERRQSESNTEIATKHSRHFLTVKNYTMFRHLRTTLSTKKPNKNIL